MKKIDRVLYIVSIISIFFFSILAYFLAKDKIFVLQGYIDFSIQLILFWVGIFLLSYVTIKKDIGYLKMVMFLLMIYSVLSLVLYAVRDDTKYDLYTSNEHSVIIKLYDDNIRDYVTVYHGDGNSLYSEIYQTRFGKYYDVTYAIVDDNFVITQCHHETCTNIEVELD